MSSVEQSGFAPGDLVRVDEVTKLPLGWERAPDWYGFVAERDGHLSSGTGWAESRIPIRPVGKLQLIIWMRPNALELVQGGEQ